MDKEAETLIRALLLHLEEYPEFDFLNRHSDEWECRFCYGVDNVHLALCPRVEIIERAKEFLKKNEQSEDITTLRRIYSKLNRLINGIDDYDESFLDTDHIRHFAAMEIRKPLYELMIKLTGKIDADR